MRGEKMREGEEIFKDTLRGSKIPEGYNLIEGAVFGVLRQIVIMYKRGEMSKEDAKKNKERIYGEYEREKKDFELTYGMYNDSVKRSIIKTENDRIKLRKKIKEYEENKKEIGGDEYREILRICLNIIEGVFPGEITGIK